MAALDLTSFAAALKQYYTNDMVENMVYKDNPLHALLPKMTMFGGKNLPIPIIYANPQGRSKTFATAQANKTPSKITDFVLTRNHDYGLASIDNETMLASQGNKNAFMEAATTEIDGALQAVTRSLAIAEYRDGSGTIGRVANTTFTVAVATLVNADDVTNFEVGQEIQFSSAATSATLRNSGAALTIQAVDRSLGTVTFDAVINTVITAAATNDYMNVEGDIELAIKGLDAWLPASSPSATEFFGVNRSVDPTRLAGYRFDGSNLPIEEALIEIASMIGRGGGSPSHSFLNFDKYSDLEKALGSKVQYVDLKANAEIAFRGILVNGPKGPIRVIPDQNALSNVSFMLQLDKWKLYSLGSAPMILDSDGNRMLREASADAVEVRTGYYAQLGTRGPGFSGRVTLS